MTTFKDISLNNILFTLNELTSEYLIGEIIMWPNTTNIPKGFLECDGSERSETTYDKLYNVIGYKYGSNGNKFKLPNLNTGDSDENRTYIKGLSNYNNYASETLIGGNNQIESNQIPSHNHNITQQPTVSMNPANTFINDNNTGFNRIHNYDVNNTRRAYKTSVSNSNLQSGSQNERYLWDHEHTHNIEYNNNSIRKLVNAIDNNLDSTINYNISPNESTHKHYKPRSVFINYLIYSGYTS